MSLIIDIETVGADLDSDPVAAAVEAAADAAAAKLQYGHSGRTAEQARAEARIRIALYPWTAQVAVFACWDTEKQAGICLMADGDDYNVGDAAQRYTLIACPTEVELVTKAWHIIGRQKRIVTWNGLDFDVPFLVVRAMVLETTVSQALLDAKPWEGTHYDMCERTKLGYGGRTTLEVACLAMGIDNPKCDIAGKDVGEAWAGGRKLDVARYCCRDVTALHKIWERYCKTTGRTP